MLLFLITIVKLLNVSLWKCRWESIKHLIRAMNGALAYKNKEGEKWTPSSRYICSTCKTDFILSLRTQHWDCPICLYLDPCHCLLIQTLGFSFLLGLVQITLNPNESDVQVEASRHDHKEHYNHSLKKRHHFWGCTKKQQCSNSMMK